MKTQCQIEIDLKKVDLTLKTLSSSKYRIFDKMNELKVQVEKLKGSGSWGRKSNAHKIVWREDEIETYQSIGKDITSLYEYWMDIYREEWRRNGK